MFGGGRWEHRGYEPWLWEEGSCPGWCGAMLRALRPTRRPIVDVCLRVGVRGGGCVRSREGNGGNTEVMSPVGGNRAHNLFDMEATDLVGLPDLGDPDMQGPGSIRLWSLYESLPYGSETVARKCEPDLFSEQGS